MRVLVIEDFEVLATAIGTGLRREGMAVDVVLDGADALEHLAVTRYDVVVLDRDLPRGLRGRGSGGLGVRVVADRAQRAHALARHPLCLRGAGRGPAAVSRRRDLPEDLVAVN